MSVQRTKLNHIVFNAAYRKEQWRTEEFGIRHITDIHVDHGICCTEYNGFPAIASRSDRGLSIVFMDAQEVVYVESHADVPLAELSTLVGEVAKHGLVAAKKEWEANQQ